MSSRRNYKKRYNNRYRRRKNFYKYSPHAYYNLFEEDLFTEPTNSENTLQEYNNSSADNTKKDEQKTSKQAAIPKDEQSTSAEPSISIREKLAAMASNTEVKHILRKIEFPTCAKEALFKIEQLLFVRASSIKHMDLAIDLVAEFVFSEIDRRGNKKPASLTSLQQLQLIQVLCEYFSGPATEQVKNTVFLSLFPTGLGNSLTLRIKILCKFVSMAISISTPSVLLAAGIWMQQLGNTSTYSLQLAKSLISDFFIFTPSVVPRLRKLPSVAPQFTANFLTAIAEIYLTEKRNSFTPPPQNLLETITYWVSDNFKLCTAGQNQQSSLPSGAIQMAAITPFAGLLKWCILSPVYFAITPNKSSPLLTKDIKANNDEINDDNELYDQLHLSLIQSLVEAGPGTGPPTAISAQHLVSVIPTLQLQIEELVRLGRVLETDEALQMALDRLAQSTQVALSSRCMYGNIQDLLNQLEQLPPCKLLKIVIEKHKEIVL